MKYIFQFIIISLVTGSTIIGSGVIIPTNVNYPKDLLKNKASEITVNINGNVAETIVYEEFKNESDFVTDGVYSFPLPPEAKCYGIYYWRNDTLYKAILEVQPQETNPGTGSDIIAAKVNSYIGKNGIKIKLLGIKPGVTQKIEIHYLNILNYSNGTYFYNFPLNTTELFNSQVEHLDIKVNVKSDQQILGYKSHSHNELKTIFSNDSLIKASYSKSKVYLAKDFNFSYTIKNDDLTVQFLSTLLNSSGGHYSIFYNTQDSISIEKRIDNNIVFLIDNSSLMYGVKLQQSIDAIKEGLLLLKESDLFNITICNYSNTNWRNNSQLATIENINDAFVFLESLNSGGFCNFESGIENALTQIVDTSKNNSIIAFTTGMSPVDISRISELNTYQTGITCVGVGDDISRARLELITNANNGTTFYFNETNYNRNVVIELIRKITNPIAKNVSLSFEKEDTYDSVPNNSPALFAGSNFYSSGKYISGGQSVFAILGDSKYNKYQKVFEVEFEQDSIANSLADKIWAKSKIDRLEWEIEVNGESPELKDSLTNISLRYGIRCRYTSYIADYENKVTDITNDKLMIPNDFSLLSNNYPNPFNPTTKFRFYISKHDVGKTKILKIFNVIGQLVFMIDISSYTNGWHEIIFNGTDFNGKNLASGTYLVALQINNEITNTIKIVLIK